MDSRSGRVPDAINQLGEQLEHFRSTHPRRTKLPEALWQAAVEEARRHGIYMVAHVLRLDYRERYVDHILCSDAGGFTLEV